MTWWRTHVQWMYNIDRLTVVHGVILIVLCIGRATPLCNSKRNTRNKQKKNLIKKMFYYAWISSKNYYYIETLTTMTMFEILLACDDIIPSVTTIIHFGYQQSMQKKVFCNQWILSTLKVIPTHRAHKWMVYPKN